MKIDPILCLSLENNWEKSTKSKALERLKNS